MMERNGRRVIQLGDVIRFGNGKAIRPGGYGRFPVYGSNGIIGGSEGYRYENGIIIGRVGAYCGSVAYCPDKFWASDNTLVAFPASEHFDTKFLFYLLTNAKLSQYAGGAAQPLVTQSVLKQVEVIVPSLSIQRRIAGILSAYDDLIENCQRRIRILETMARSLYREWFVHFRYPGHENHPRVDSPLGMIPKGWNPTSLGSVTTKIGSGSTPKGGKGSYHQSGVPLIRSLNIYDYDFSIVDLAYLDDEQSDLLRNVTVQKGDILLNITGASVARCSIAPSYLLPARVNQHVAIIRANQESVSPYFILDTINCDIYKAKILALAQGGATREALTKETLEKFEILLPPSGLLAQYHKIAKGVHSQRELLSYKIQNLRRTRDLLLLRLLSGQIELKAD